MKLVWIILFLISLVLHALIFFGAASGGSTNPPMMYAIWAAVIVGVGSGLFTVYRLTTTNEMMWVDWVTGAVAIWPLFWLALAIAKAVLK